MGTKKQLNWGRVGQIQGNERGYGKGNTATTQAASFEVNLNRGTKSVTKIIQI